MKKICRWLNILFVIIVCCLVHFRIIDAFSTFNLNLILVFLALVYLAKQLFIERDHYERLAFGPLGVALIVLVIVEAVVYLASSYRPNSFNALVEILYAFLFFYFVKHNLGDTRRWVMLFLGMTIVGFLYSVGAAIRFIKGWSELSALGFGDLTFFKDNLLYGDWIVNSLLLLPYPLILLVRFRDRAWKSILLIAALFLVSIWIVFSFSRGAYVALLVFVVLINAAFVMYKLLPLKTLVRFNCIMLALVVLASLPMMKSVVSAASLFKTASQTISFSSRKQIWAQSLGMVRDNPVLGVGSYNYATNFMAAGEHNPGKGFVRTPQNAFIGILVEKGIIGLLAYVGVLAAAFYTAYRKLVRSKEDFEKVAAVSIAASLAAAVVYGFTYYPPFGNQATVTLTWLIYACLECGSSLPLFFQKLN